MISFSLKPGEIPTEVADLDLLRQIEGSPELAEALQPMSAKRRMDFLLGRYCAVRAIQRLLGTEAVPLVAVSHDRAPIWPDGIVGSITHTVNFVSACVARSTEIRGLGIDCEARISMIPEKREMSLQLIQDLEQLALVEEEKVLASTLEGALEYRDFVLLVFSAKESVYKCFQPLVRRYIDFKEVAISSVKFHEAVHPAEITGTFTFVLLNDLDVNFRRGRTFAGSFTFSAQFVETCFRVA
ncbi:MAG: 4'-phosphopantetheinyl transferase superfamily protein [Methylotenera sp.]|nr:4'-phosphopantetheinyl transferase superfamily protein [Oligoflexia bacterium]